MPKRRSTRRGRSAPVSVDVLPVTLKEIFLETVGRGEVEWSGLRLGSTRAGGSRYLHRRCSLALTCFHVFEWPARAVHSCRRRSVRGGRRRDVRNAVAEAIAVRADVSRLRLVSVVRPELRFVHRPVRRAARQRQRCCRHRAAGCLFSLALPVARGRWLEARAAIGVAQFSCSRSCRRSCSRCSRPWSGRATPSPTRSSTAALIFVSGSVFLRARDARVGDRRRLRPRDRPHGGRRLGRRICRVCADRAADGLFARSRRDSLFPHRYVAVARPRRLGIQLPRAP